MASASVFFVNSMPFYGVVCAWAGQCDAKQIIIFFKKGTNVRTVRQLRRRFGTREIGEERERGREGEREGEREGGRERAREEEKKNDLEGGVGG